MPELNFEIEATKARTFATDLVIVQPADYERAGNERGVIVKLVKAISEHHKPLVEGAHKLHQAAIAARDSLLAGPNEAIRIIDGKTLAWKREQDRIRAEQEAIVRAAAQKAAEDAALAEAAMAEAAGDTETAEAIIAEPVVAPPVFIPTSVPKVKGMTTAKRWTYDESAVNADLLPEEYWMIDHQKLRGVIRSGVHVIPGVLIFEVESMRGARS